MSLVNDTDVCHESLCYTCQTLLAIDGVLGFCYGFCCSDVLQSRLVLEIDCDFYTDAPVMVTSSDASVGTR